VSPDVESLTHAAAIVALALAAAVTAEWSLRRVRRRLPLILTRRAMGGHANHPDPAFLRVVDLVLLPLRLGVWLLAGWALTEQSSTLRVVRTAVAGAVRMALTTPLFELEHRAYSLLGSDSSRADARHR
jgi:hypothetical protein